MHVFDASVRAQAGHYQPVHRPLSQIEAQAATLGLHHLVLVQPSVYGSDNSLLLRALQVQPGRHRGVVVLGEHAAANGSAATQQALQALQHMHSAGVRGARLNCVSPVGEGAAAEARYARLAPLLVAQGWHLQWYAGAEQLPRIAALHTAGPAAQTPVCVLDHLAGMHAALPHQHPAWAALQALADRGAWVKLAGWYRLQAAQPYAELVPVVQRLATLFGPRLVWGSDWPHTSFAADAAPPYATTWAPVVAALGAARAVQVHEAAAVLYR